jgi:hypothetical protein
MSRIPLKTALAGAVVLALAGYAFAAQLAPGNRPVQPFGQMQPYGQMPPSGQGMPQQGGMMRPMHSMDVMGQMGAMHAHMSGGPQDMADGMHDGPHPGMNGHQVGPQFGAAGIPTMPGQEAFGTIQEIINLLEADPSTDWSKVNIAALREHLIDMDEVTMRAAAKPRLLEGGIEFTVTGAGRTLTAIKRMVPMHTGVLRSMGWNARAVVLPDGVKLTVMASEGQPLVKLKALGFIGIMAQGANHQPHHLMMAKGEMHMPVH